MSKYMSIGPNDMRVSRSISGSFFRAAVTILPRDPLGLFPRTDFRFPSLDSPRPQQMILAPGVRSSQCDNCLERRQSCLGGDFPNIHHHHMKAGAYPMARAIIQAQPPKPPLLAGEISTVSPDFAPTSFKCCVAVVCTVQEA